MPEVSIIILNYNTFQLTCNCIESVVKHTKDVSYEIILVDNNSTECNAELFLEKFTSIKLIKSNINGGFAKGNNLGIEAATGNYILLLNSDTYLIEDAISNTFKATKNRNVEEVIGCKMIFESGKIQHTARKFRSINWEILDLLRIVLYILPYSTRAKLMLGKYFNCDFSTTCDWLNGAFFMFSKSMLQNLPNQKLDERFFMYGEDHLWCLQFKQLGYDCFFYEKTKLVHINNGSTSKEKQLKLRNVMLFNELVIMKLRKRNGFYFNLFKLIFTIKEKSRNFILGLLK